MHFRDVVDQFLNKNCLTNTGTTEQPNLTTFCVRREKVDNFDACDQHFGRSGLRFERWGISVDRATLFLTDWTTFIDWLTDDVHDATKCGFTNWHSDRAVSVSHSLTANEAFCGVHRNCANSVFAKVLGHFEHQLLAVVIGFNRVQDLWQVIVELNIYNGANHLGDFAFCVSHNVSPVLLKRFRARNDFNQLVGDHSLT